jgi:hypothetical protein
MLSPEIVALTLAVVVLAIVALVAFFVLLPRPSGA